jgi:GT2 family glycosyltransferase
MSQPSHEAEVPVLSLITVTWNGKRYVEECLQSLSMNVDVPAEFIVVDNASTDGTPELIEKAFSQFRVVRNAKNLGFAKANNIGMRLSRGKYLCLVNSDVVVPPGCLGSLYEYLEANPDVAVAGPQMLGKDGKVHRSSMRLPTIRNAFCRAFALDTIPCVSRLLRGQLMSDFSHDHTCEVEVLNGWFWMIRRTAMESVGPLDERFFMYGEDLDWCRRFREAGWLLVFYAGVQALHYGGGSSRIAPVRFYLEMHRANIQYWRKHNGLTATVLYETILVVHHLIRIFGHSVTYLFAAKRRADLAAKIDRSWKLIAWLSGAYRQADAHG